MKSKTKSDKKTSSRNKNALARNRIAASKCRVKKKEWTENLQLEKTGVEAIHKELHTQYITLLQEACALKNHIINHAGCCDPNIDGWISNEAAKFARRLMGGELQPQYCERAFGQKLDTRDSYDTYHCLKY